MKTQLFITVKNELFLNKLTTFSWFIQIFKKSRTYVYIDGKEHVLKAAKKPYVFDLEPGEHEIIFKDYLEDAKRRFWKVTFGFIGACINMAFNKDPIRGASRSARDGTISEKMHVMNPQLNEGDILSVSCKNGFLGKVKVKQI